MMVLLEFETSNVRQPSKIQPFSWSLSLFIKAFSFLAYEVWLNQNMNYKIEASALPYPQ